MLLFYPTFCFPLPSYKCSPYEITHHHPYLNNNNNNSSPLPGSERTYKNISDDFLHARGYQKHTYSCDSNDCARG